MKIPPLKNKGMETATSMFLLLISALLIFSILSQIDNGRNNEGSLMELRAYQARSLGESLMRYSNSSTESPFLAEDRNTDNGSVFFWTGMEFYHINTNSTGSNGHIRDVIETTPDGLSSLILVGDPDEIDLGVTGEYVTWSSQTHNDVRITVYISFHTGSIELTRWDP